MSIFYLLSRQTRIEFKKYKKQEDQQQNDQFDDSVTVSQSLFTIFSRENSRTARLTPISGWMYHKSHIVMSSPVPSIVLSLLRRLRVLFVRRTHHLSMPHVS